MKYISLLFAICINFSLFAQRQDNWLSQDLRWRNIGPANMMGRIAGLNRQVDIFTETVWHRLLRKDSTEPSAARSYVFGAVPERFESLLEQLLARVRTDILAEEERAFSEGERRRHAITIAGTILPEEES